MTDLKPCPFCGMYDASDDDGTDGSWDQDLTVEEDDLKYWTIYYVKCSNCNATGPTSMNKEQAIDFWNSRLG